MREASPASLNLARRLIAREASRAERARGRTRTAIEGSGADVVTVCAKLQAILTALAGAAGFRSLLTRALTLARVEEPTLASVQVSADGSLAGLVPVGEEPGTGTGGVVAGAGDLLVAHLLDLLTVFVGAALTHQLVRRGWPDVPVGPPHSETKDTL